MAAGEQDWKPGSFTKNFSWGPPANGLLQLYESIRIGFDLIMEDVPRDLFRERVSQYGHSEYIRFAVRCPLGIGAFKQGLITFQSLHFIDRFPELEFCIQV